MTDSQDTAAVFLPYQRRWELDDAQFKVYEKSRRIGISWAEAAGAVLHAVAGKGDYYYMSYNREMTRGFIEDCKKWTESFNGVLDDEEVLQDDPRTDSMVYEMRYSTGKKIQALSGNACNIRSKGRPGDVFGIDEAAFVPSLAELLKAANAALVWGGKVRVWSTHNGQLNPFNQLVNDIRSGRSSHSLHRTTIDDAISEGLYKRICQITKRQWSPQAEVAWREQLFRDYGDGAEEELLVVPAADRGAWLSRALIERCCQPACRVLRWRPPAAGFVMQSTSTRESEMRRWFEINVLPVLRSIHSDQSIQRTCVGVDFGRSGDLSVFALPAVHQDMHISFPLIVELRDCPFEQQRQLLVMLVDKLRNFAGVGLDARGNGQYLAEVAQQHLGSGLADAINLSEDWYRTNMPPLKAGFEDQAIEIPADEDIVEDLRSVELRNGVPRVPDIRRTGADGKQRHSDAAIAIAIALAIAKRGRVCLAEEFVSFERASRYPGYAPDLRSTMLGGTL